MKFAIYLTIGLFAFSGLMLVEKLGKSYYQVKKASIQANAKPVEKRDAKPVRPVKVAQAKKRSSLKGKKLSNVEIEEESFIGPLKNPETVIVELVRLIRATGYRCDSVTTVRKWGFSVGFSMSCNWGRYDYEIADRGGRWQVKLK